MKHSFKIAALVAALGFAGVMHPASAAILYVDTDGVAATGGAGDGNGSSFLFYATDANGLSYAKSINFRMDQVSTQSTPISFSLPGLSSFFASAVDAQWGLLAADTVNGGQGSYKGYRVTQGQVSDQADDLLLNNAAVKGLGNTFKTFLLNADATAPTHVAGDVLTSVSLDDEWNLGNASFQSAGANLATLADNEVMYAWTFANTSNTVTGASAETLAPYSFSLNLSGNQLNFATPPPAPVPLPAAVWLLGSALATVAGVRRRRLANTASA